MMVGKETEIGRPCTDTPLMLDMDSMFRCAAYLCPDEDGRR